MRMQRLRATVAFTAVLGVLSLAPACGRPVPPAPTTTRPALGPRPAPPPSLPGRTRPTDPLTASGGRPFATDSPFNALIRPLPHVDPQSGAMVARLTAGPPAADIYEYGEPVVTVGRGDAAPTFPVPCSQSPDWGPCAFDGRRIPIPPTARPDPGDDGALTVVDLTGGLVYSFWQARREPAGEGPPTAWTASWAGTAWLWGSGQDAPTSSRGSGISRLAGVIRTWEIPQGVIPHALVFASNATCKTAYRPPARKTDGVATGAGCVPMGARVQLDPTVDVARAPMTPAEKVIARALQTYGAYAVDTAPSPFAISFENPTRSSAESPAGLPDPYPGLGIDQYAPLPGVPWKRLRVLARWDGL